MMIPYVLVTGNAGKLEEARRILGPGLEAVNLDLPEIQSLDPGEILEAKAEQAWRRIGRPVLVEETSLELAALGGFPGPLVKWMLAAVGAAGIARTALALGDAGARARCSVLAWDGREGIAAEGVVAGRLVSPPRGEGGFGWDPIFVPEGQELTFAELPAAVKDGLSHRGRALRALAARLQI
ncbi:MAG TPA: non-canonical purine NTP pyrophosphatase [Thermoanaerobaculia bacterium]|nr:non-canonical purine NTP pyrophosphatase [Thermoanaerobaculia bacterium]